LDISTKPESRDPATEKDLAQSALPASGLELLVVEFEAAKRRTQQSVFAKDLPIYHNNNLMFK